MYLDIKLGRYGEGTPLGRVMIELKVSAAQTCGFGAAMRLQRAAPCSRRAWRCGAAALVRRSARVGLWLPAESPRVRRAHRPTSRLKRRRTSASCGASLHVGARGARKDAARYIALTLSPRLRPHPSLNPEGQGFTASRFHRIIPGFMCQGCVALCDAAAIAR